MIEGFPDGEAHHRKFMHAVKGWLNPDITVNDSDMKRCFRDAITEAYGLTSFPRVSPTSTAYDPRALRFFRRRNDRSATRPSHFVARAAQEETPADELPRAARLTKPERHAFIECLKGLPIPIDGTLGFDQVEVTAGGLSLRELNPRSLEVNRRPGLYVCGELLDLNGPMGGFSFLAAWATAEMVGAALSSDTS